MPSLSEKDKANFEACLEAIEKIKIFTTGINDADQFFQAEMTFDATLMNFVVIGEVMSKISPETQKRYQDIAWPQI